MSSVGQKGEPTRNHLFLVRSHLVNSLKTARVELGLSPKAASALVSPVLEDGDPDGVFD
jgi:phage terminase small subunit